MISLIYKDYNGVGVVVVVIVCSDSITVIIFFRDCKSRGSYC